MTVVVQLMQNTLWFPHDQETPRRLFALLWTTIPVRAVSLLSPGNINLAMVVYGIAAYLQIAIPLIIILRSHLILPVRSLLIVLFIGATIFLVNFAASELLFAIGLTSIFVVYTLDGGRDPQCRKRLVAAVLLLASYEVVVLSNLVLALGTLLLPAPTMTRRRLLIAILVAALPFQFFCFYFESIRPGQDVFNRFVFELAGIGSLGVAAAILLAKGIARWRAAQAAVVLVCIAISLLVLAAPEHLIYLRTREFQYAYPSRIFSAGMTVAIALLPVLLNRRLWLWPSRLLDWVGARPLGNLAAAALVAFYGVSIVASVDAFAFWKRLGTELSRLSGLIPLEECEYCSHPEMFGYANLGEPTHWPAYSMAHSLRNRAHARVVVVPRDHPGDITPDEVVAFLNAPRSTAVRHNARASDTVACCGLPRFWPQGVMTLLRTVIHHLFLLEA
ncbi:MAG: hypothetical protein JO283_16560 [Bradyrhizobium sp.]|nr:hypothetical protein [Bradyrhizobium sp.]